MRIATVRADSTVDPEMDPQDEEVLPPDREGEGEISEHQEHLDEHMEIPQYQWDTEEEEKTEDNTVPYRASVIRIVLDEEKHGMTKVMASEERQWFQAKPLNLCIAIGQDIESYQAGHAQITVPYWGTGK